MGKIGILQGLFKYVGCSDLSHEPRSDVASSTVYDLREQKHRVYYIETQLLNFTHE